MFLWRGNGDGCGHITALAEADPVAKRLKQHCKVRNLMFLRNGQVAVQWMEIEDNEKGRTAVLIPLTLRAV